ncbi:MAG: peptide ABC transporter substrate-binding protein [Eubacteriales bacterium]
MKKFLSALLAMVMLAGSLLSLSSCGKLVMDGAEINIYLNDEVFDFDPAMSYTDDNALLAMSLLFEPLFVVDRKGKLQKAAAKSYDIDKDNHKIYITLRESYWSDGQVVMADDFVYAWRRILDPTNQSPAAALLFDIKNAVKVKHAEDGLTVYDLGIHSLDSNRTLEITLEGEIDYDAFLYNLASVMLSPVRAAVVQGQDSVWAKSATTIYTNGPFKLRTFNLLYGYFTLARNADYHRPANSKKPVDKYVTPAVIRTLWNVESGLSKRDYLTQLQEYVEQNLVFYLGSLSPEARREVSRARNLETADRLSTYTYVFNTENPLFADPEVRQILSAVLDREQIAEIAVFAKPATGLIPQGVFNTNSRRSSFRKKGGALLSGTAGMSIDEAYDALDDIGAPRGTFSITYQQSEEEQEIAFYVKDIWEQLGYRVNIKGVSETQVEYAGVFYTEAELQLTYETGDFDVIAIDYQMMSVNALPVLSTLTSTLNGNGTDMDYESEDYLQIKSNPANWSNEAYDELIASARQEKDDKKRADILHDAEELLMEELPVMPLLFNQTYYLLNKNLKKVTVDYFGYPVFTKAKLRKYDRYFLEEIDKILFPEEEEE